MRILAIERAGAGAATGGSLTLLKAEAAKVWKLQRSEVVREVYFRADRHEAVPVLECPGVEKAAATLSTFPLVEAGLIALGITPLAAYNGFSRLFGADGSSEEHAGS